MVLATIEQRQFGLKKEASRGVAETTATKWYPVSKDSVLNTAIAIIEDTQLRGVPESFPGTQGVKSYDGKLKMSLDAQSCGELFYSLLGSCSSAEQPALVISAANKFLDFNIGAAELVATVAESSYKFGTDQTQAGTLCKAIYDAIHAAEAAGTYTVTYSTTTKKFTITRSAGTFNILWKTGTHGNDGALKTNIGIASGIQYTQTADDTGSLSYVSDTAMTVYGYKHSITRLNSTERHGYTLFIDHGLFVKKYTLGTVKKISLNGPVDNLIDLEADVLAIAEASGDIGTASYPTPRYLTFANVTVKVDTVEATSIKNWKLDIDNGAAPYRVLSQSQDPSNIMIKGKYKIDGSMLVYFTDETERTKFLAGTTSALQFLIEGQTIGGAVKYTVDINLPRCMYKAYPFGEDDGLLAANVTFEAHYDPNTSKAISVDVTNQEISY